MSVLGGPLLRAWGKAMHTLLPDPEQMSQSFSGDMVSSLQTAHLAFLLGNVQGDTSSIVHVCESAVRTLLRHKDQLCTSLQRELAVVCMCTEKGK